MSESEPPVAAAARSTSRKLWLVLTLVVLAVVAYFVLAAFLPRWWAQTVGDFVQQSFVTGAVSGLGIGFVCTALPLLAVRAGVRRNASTLGRVAWILLALVLAIPNLLTLTVVLGGGSGAHAGQRILDVTAPAFRGGSLVGALAAAAILLGIQLLSTTRRMAERTDR